MRSIADTPIGSARAIGDGDDVGAPALLLDLQRLPHVR